MTAPAATLIKRQSPQSPSRADLWKGLNESIEPARQTPGAASGKPANAGFAAHLEYSSPPRAAQRTSNHPRPANAINTIRPAPARADAARDAARWADLTNEPATGKTLPDTRQTHAHPAKQTVMDRLNTRAAARGEDTRSDAAKADAQTQSDEAEANTVPVVPAQVAAPTLGAPPTPQRSAASLPSGKAARTGTAPDIAADRAAATPAMGTTDTAVASPAASAAATAGSIAAQALSFTLDGDGQTPGTPDLAAAEAAPGDAPSSAAQSAARAQPSTLAALTGATTPDRPTLRKARAEAETTLSDTEAPATGISASTLALAQPAAAQTGELPVLRAATQPPEGIGFDALVDSIARARDGAADGASVAVAMRHAEFGSVSMRFNSDADGLSVAMTSPDPTFAPAVAAAHAAEAAATANAEAAQRSAQTSTALGGAGNQDGHPMQGSARGGTGQRQDGQRQDGQPQPRVSAEATRGPARGIAESRSGIFA